MGFHFCCYAIYPASMRNGPLHIIYNAIYIHLYCIVDICIFHLELFAQRLYICTNIHDPAQVKRCFSSSPQTWSKSAAPPPTFAGNDDITVNQRSIRYSNQSPALTRCLGRARGDVNFRLEWQNDLCC